MIAYIKRYVSEQEADMLVKDFLITLGYASDLEIKRYILDNNRISYSIYNSIIYKGKKTSILSIIDCSKYMNILMKAFDSKNIVTTNIFPYIKGNKLSYYVEQNGDIKKKVKRMV